MPDFFLQLWAWSILVAAIGFLVCRYRPWLALFVVPLAGLFPLLFALSTFRPQKALDSGVSTQVKIATLLVLAVLAIGLHLGKFKVAFFGLYEGRLTPPEEKK